jgi:hypothetical protein
MVENRVLRRIGRDRSSDSKMMKRRIIAWKVCVARMGETMTTLESKEEADEYRDQDVHGWIILKGRLERE